MRSSHVFNLHFDLKYVLYDLEYVQIEFTEK